MSESAAFLAIDLGAESGRVLSGSFDGERVTLNGVRRFPNEPVKITSGLHWDILSIFAEKTKGLVPVVSS